MQSVPSSVRGLVKVFAVVLGLLGPAAGGDRSSSRTLRWLEGAPNCSLRAAGDGHTYYELSAGDFMVTLAVDRQELEKIPHREVSMIAAYISVHYKGREPVDITQTKITLEFSKHRHVRHLALDREGMIHDLQKQIDDVTDDFQRHQMRKQPELREKKEAEFHQRLADDQEMIAFVNTHGLRSVTLDPTNPSVSGWVFFSTKDAWIGAWRPPEQFILRVPIKNLIVEFPFQLPPKPGSVQLRRRPEKPSD